MTLIQSRAETAAAAMKNAEIRSTPSAPLDGKCRGRPKEEKPAEEDGESSRARRYSERKRRLSQPKDGADKRPRRSCDKSATPVSQTDAVPVKPEVVESRIVLNAAQYLPLPALRGRKGPRTPSPLSGATEDGRRATTPRKIVVCESPNKAARIVRSRSRCDDEMQFKSPVKKEDSRQQTCLTAGSEPVVFDLRSKLRRGSKEPAGTRAVRAESSPVTSAKSMPPPARSDKILELPRTGRPPTASVVEASLLVPGRVLIVGGKVAPQKLPAENLEEGEIEEEEIPILKDSPTFCENLREKSANLAKSRGQVRAARIEVQLTNVFSRSRIELTRQMVSSSLPDRTGCKVRTASGSREAATGQVGKEIQVTGPLRENVRPVLHPESEIKKKIMSQTDPTRMEGVQETEVEVEKKGGERKPDVMPSLRATKTIHRVEQGEPDRGTRDGKDKSGDNVVSERKKIDEKTNNDKKNSIQPQQNGIKKNRSDKEESNTGKEVKPENKNQSQEIKSQHQKGNIFEEQERVEKKESRKSESKNEKKGVKESRQVEDSGKKREKVVEKDSFKDGSLCEKSRHVVKSRPEENQLVMTSCHDEKKIKGDQKKEAKSHRHKKSHKESLEKEQSHLESQVTDQKHKGDQEKEHRHDESRLKEVSRVESREKEPGCMGNQKKEPSHKDNQEKQQQSRHRKKEHQEQNRLEENSHKASRRQEKSGQDEKSQQEQEGQSKEKILHGIKSGQQEKVHLEEKKQTELHHRDKSELKDKSKKEGRPTEKSQHEEKSRPVLHCKEQSQQKEKGQKKEEKSQCEEKKKHQEGNKESRHPARSQQEKSHHHDKSNTKEKQRQEKNEKEETHRQGKKEQHSDSAHRENARQGGQPKEKKIVDGGSTENSSNEEKSTVLPQEDEGTEQLRKEVKTKSPIINRKVSDSRLDRKTKEKAVVETAKHKRVSKSAHVQPGHACRPVQDCGDQVVITLTPVMVQPPEKKVDPQQTGDLASGAARASSRQQQAKDVAGGGGSTVESASISAENKMKQQKPDHDGQTQPTAKVLVDTQEAAPSAGVLVDTLEAMHSAGVLVDTPESAPSAGVLVDTPEATHSTGVLVDTPEAALSVGVLVDTPIRAPSAGVLVDTQEAAPSAGVLVDTPEAAPSAGLLVDTPESAPLSVFQVNCFTVVNDLWTR